MNMNNHNSHDASAQLAHEERVRRCAELGIIVPIRASHARQPSGAVHFGGGNSSNGSATAKQ